MNRSHTTNKSHGLQWKASLAYLFSFSLIFQLAFIPASRAESDDLRARQAEMIRKFSEEYPIFQSPRFTRILVEEFAFFMHDFRSKFPEPFSHDPLYPYRKLSKFLAPDPYLVESYQNFMKNRIGP